MLDENLPIYNVSSVRKFCIIISKKWKRKTNDTIYEPAKYIAMFVYAIYLFDHDHDNDEWMFKNVLEIKTTEIFDTFETFLIF